ncbi:murein DD-endopeptidase MepM/ murein hydrolase activator NlpD [Streptacidiphilus sp. MAP12-20]|uniref:M23 family metallopeptidase n=1 Tax=Streptacidiphilus sp. MAP12-20 TaxID=3156299 RepID=UPI0035160F89
MRTGWGAVLTVGVGALLPAMFAPSGAHPVATGWAGAAGGVGGAGGVRPSRPVSLASLAQDAALRGESLVRGRGRLRFAEGLFDDRPPVPAWPVPVPLPAPDWFSPALGARISQVFGVPDSEYAAGYHTGVDFAVFTGTPLLAVARATVEVAGWGGAYGNWVVLRLPDGHFALYAHMSRLDVRTGERVAAGQQVGLSGDTGHTRGPHLHFEIRTRNEYGAVVDPLTYLRAHGCRL